MKEDEAALIASLRPFLGNLSLVSFVEDFAKEGFRAETLFELAPSVSTLDDINGTYHTCI